MKRIHDYAALQLWRDPGTLRSTANVESLASARYEPVIRDLIGYGLVDLTFARADSFCVIPGILIDPMQLTVRQSSPFVWPDHVTRALAEPELEAIEERVTPWLRSLSRGRPLSSEEIRHFRDPAAFERARALGLPGAVPIADCVRRIAPFVYAARFADGARVKITCADAATAMAVLRWRASAFDAPLATDSESEFTRRWYALPPLPTFTGPATIVIGNTFESIDSSARLAVAVQEDVNDRDAHIIDVPQAVPLDVLFTFDAADAPATRRFAVRARPTPPMRAMRFGERPIAKGGSAGVVAFARRDDAALAPGADTDESDELAGRLRAEGLQVRLAASASDPAIGSADLLHIFGAFSDPHVVAYATAAIRAKIPYVLNLNPVADWSTWIESTPSVAIRASLEDDAIQRFLASYEQKLLIVDEMPVDVPANIVESTYQHFSSVAQGAAAIFTSSGADAARITQRVPTIPIDRIVVSGSFVAPEPPEEDIAWRIPDRPFVLIHAPISLRSNILFALLALARTEIPIVIAGEIYDVSTLIQVNRLCGERTIVVPDPTPGVLAALYRRAAVWLDVMPRPQGTSRLLRAAACGALPIVPRSSPLADYVEHDAPTFVLPIFASLAEAVQAGFDAPDRAALAVRIANRNAAFFDAHRPFAAVVEAYARTSEPV